MRKYLNLLQDVEDYGVMKENRTGVRTKSLHANQLRVRPQLGFPLLTTKRVHFKSILVEWLWMMLGHTDTKFLKDRGCTIWNEWSTYDQCAKRNRMINDMGPIYGHLWRNFGGSESPHYKEMYSAYNKQVKERLSLATTPDDIAYIKECSTIVKDKVLRDKLSTNTMALEPSLIKDDYLYPFLKDGFDQVAWVLKELKFNPDSRRAIVTGWDPKAALEVELPPCHTMWQFTTFVNKKGKRVLSLHLTQRSQDVFLGLPFNVAFYAITLQIFCTILGYNMGEECITGVDTHIYENHKKAVATQVERTPTALPVLEISRWAQEALSKFGRTITQESTLQDIGIAFDKVLTEVFLKPMDLHWSDPTTRNEPTIYITGYNPHDAIKAPVAV